MCICLSTESLSLKMNDFRSLCHYKYLSVKCVSVNLCTCKKWPHMGQISCTKRSEGNKKRREIQWNLRSLPGKRGIESQRIRCPSWVTSCKGRNALWEFSAHLTLCSFCTFFHWLVTALTQCRWIIPVCCASMAAFQGKTNTSTLLSHWVCSFWGMIMLHTVNQLWPKDKLSSCVALVKWSWTSNSA